METHVKKVFVRKDRNFDQSQYSQREASTNGNAHFNHSSKQAINELTPAQRFRNITFGQTTYPERTNASMQVASATPAVVTVSRPMQSQEDQPTVNVAQVTSNPNLLPPGEHLLNLNPGRPGAPNLVGQSSLAPRVLIGDPVRYAVSPGAPDVQEFVVCDWCRGYYKARGLKRHKGACKKRPGSSFVSTSQDFTQDFTVYDPTAASFPTSTEGHIDSLLANLKISRRILKRIPKGARSVTADILARTMDACISENTVSAWIRLLTFASACLKVPKIKEDRQVSLATVIKANVSDFLRHREDLVPDCDPANFKNTHMNSEQRLAKYVEAKIADGDIKGAIRVICSEDSFALQNNDTLELLRAKHPDPGINLDFPPPPEDNNDQFLKVTESQVKAALRSFPAGSSGGLDSLRPQHLKDLTSKGAGAAGERLLSSLTRLCNLMLKGKIPVTVCQVLYGASLCALQKKTGGIRPIAVGNTYRRLVAKLGCYHVSDRLGEQLRPFQLGFGTPGGAEAIAHATRRFISHSQDSTKVILKIDFSNAFNMIRRDRLLHAVRESIPELYPFIYQCYRFPSSLAFGTNIILSQHGVQQGDPLGPALFSLTLNPAIQGYKSDINLWYLDDGSLGGSPENVLNDFSRIKSNVSDLGLEINSTKCELFVAHQEPAQHNTLIQQFQSAIPGITILNQDNFSILGAAMTDSAMKRSMDSKIEYLTRMTNRLSNISSHCAFYLLKNSQSIPKLTYILRCTPLWKFPEVLSSYDNILRSALETITNTSINDRAWMQASLPVSKGGLGIRHAADLALPAFLSSSSSVSTIVSSVLPAHLEDFKDEAFSDGVIKWMQLTSSDPPPCEVQNQQRKWEEPLVDIASTRLLDESTCTVDRARLLGVSSSEAGAWLCSIPSPSIGTFMDNDSFRIAIALRLGSPICHPHPCQCGATVDELGIHGLSCVKSAGRFSRHGAANDLIKRALVSAGIPAILEPSGLSRDDGKRPDGLTLVPWTRGRNMVWDFTCTDTLAPSHLRFSSHNKAWAASVAEEKKISKYNNLGDSYVFCPIAVETLGAFGPKTLSTIHAIGRKIAQNTGEPRSTSFFIQRISIAVQRGNAAAILSSVPPGESLDDVLYCI